MKTKNKKQNNKKFMMFGLLGLFAMVLVSAGIISYYGQVEQDINIESPIVFMSSTSALSGMLQSPVLGDLVTATNNADFDVDVKVRSDVTEDGEWSNLIATDYVNEVELSGKSDCYAEGTCILDSIPKAIVYYNVVGDEFVYEVESENINIEEYTLVYYPDTDGYTSGDYDGSIIPADEISESLPIVEDLNGGALSNYCDPTGYCRGAKLWLIPTSMINFDTNKIIGWNGDAYLFETDLINYFKTVDGETTIPAGVSMEFYPEYTFEAIEGNYVVTTSVSPVTA